MSKKRAAGTGSIYEVITKDFVTGIEVKSGRWRALITIEGKRISHYGRSQREVTEWAKKMMSQVDQGLTFDATQKDLATHIREWLVIKEPTLRLSTMESYSRLARLYIYPNIGELKLKDINAARIQALYSSLQEAGIGKRNVRLVHIILYGSLKYARKIGLVSQNWAELVEVPKTEKREMAVWSESQVSSFLAAYPDQVFYRLAFATGMRRGELIGLKWQDVSWTTETIRVQRQVYRPVGGGFRYQEPKSKRGFRSIRLGPGLIEALRRQDSQVIPLARMLAGDRWQENDLIFPSTIGTPRNGYEVTKEFKRLARQAGLPVIRLHDIRHTAASIMLLHGEPPVRVAAILGQSIAVLMDTYAHYIPDDQERVSRLMDEVTTPTAIDLENWTYLSDRSETTSRSHRAQKLEDAKRIEG